MPRGQVIVEMERMWLSRRAFYGVALTFILLFAACSHPRESYLKDSVDEATQEDIVKELGEPFRMKTSLLNGETTWIYRYVATEGELNPIGLSNIGQGVTKTANAAAALIGKGGGPSKGEKPICIHYLLTFDKAKVLQDWTREECSASSL